MNITEKQPHSRAYLNQRRFLLVVPMLILPFVLTGFWAMGGGQGKADSTQSIKKGINASLPGAENQSDSTMDKMAFYDQARKDSVIRASSYENDPYSQPDSTGRPLDPSMELPASQPMTGSALTDPNEVRLQQKLAALNSALNTGAATPDPRKANPSTTGGPAINNADLDRLEAMMNNMQGGGGADPEMAQINGMLGQILDIQHPDRVQSRQRQASLKAKGQVFAVATTRKLDAVTLMDSSHTKTTKQRDNGFYALAGAEDAQASQNTIEAATSESQTLVSGAIIKLKLLNEIYINGQLIPRNTPLFGLVSISGERMLVDVSSLRFGNSIFPVNLIVCDLDGLDGIHIPGAIGRDVAKESSSDALQGIGLSNMDPSLSMQAMDVGIQAAKSMIGKKIKLIKVYVKAGYRILLKDEKQKNN